ncbi:MAG: UDP-3-O-(3-hydroxymyristoyl)glucosamine N-acyltransferase [Gemmatimonadetes bacterium]|nr:UDP-3-O-(3-hydroxymyristoyl)glucosamine N-acyltransferase [Gemmatimonadota bacterium]
MNSFPLRRSEPVPHSLSALAKLLEISPPMEEMEVRGVAPLGAAGPEQLGFLAHRRYLSHLGSCRAGALLISAEMASLLPPDSRPRLVVPNAHDALTTLLEAFHPEQRTEPEVHPTAVFGTGVRIGTDVRIGPYSVIESDVVVGDGVLIGAHVVVGTGSRIGRGSILHPHCVLYPGTVLGERVIVHSGARLGVDGFGYVFRDGAHQKIPQVGSCIIEDDVEIGANTTIDRGSIGETRVGAGAKLDNLVHLAHNVSVGPRAILTAQVGVAGSATIGAGVLAGGQAGFLGHVTVGDGAKVGAQSAVMKNVAPGETVQGSPARPQAEFLRTAAAQRLVPELMRRVRRLEGSAEDDSKGPDPR